MRTVGVILLIAILAEAMRIAVLSRFAIHPDLQTGVVVLAALMLRSPTGAITGFLLGFQRDIVYGYPTGFQVLPLAVIGWLVGSLGRSVYRESLVTQAVIIFLACLGKGAFDYLFLRGGEFSGLLIYLIRITFLSALETAVLVPVLFRAWQDLRDSNFRHYILNGLRAYERKLLVKRR